jgi:two-component system chemotaxis response regulator CheB
MANTNREQGDNDTPSPTQLIRVLVVDDSVVARDLMVYVLNSDPHIQVVGVAQDGEEAVELATRLRPDVITMDIHMPRMDGYDATRRIMERCPTRIVMVTASALPFEVAETFHALEAGALTVVGRPLGPGHQEFERAARELIRTVKLMSEVSVVRRWAKKKEPPAAPPAPATELPVSTGPVRLVAIGASTGGPLVLLSILSQLGKNFGAPIVIVQHISAGFTEGFAEWLTQAAGFSVRVARQGERLQDGHAYLAPDDMQMEVSAAGVIKLTSSPPENGLRPSVSYLFRSVASHYGGKAVGVLLTGMGRDGAKELKEMKLAGAVTIAQDKESAVVFGMPGEAVKLDAARYVMAPDAIAATLQRLANGPSCITPNIRT